jgi:hypothetical protein
VAFVCPECGWELADPGGPPPFECEPCRLEGGRAVYLQDRTPGRTVTVHCGCGFSFAALASFVGTSRPCPRCGQKCRVEEGVVEVPPAPPAPKPAEPPARVEKARRPKPDGSGVRTLTTYTLGLAPIRVVSFGLLALGAVLAGLAVVRAATKLATDTPADALGELQILPVAVAVAGVGFFIRHVAYIEVWRFDPERRLATRVHRRLLSETVREEVPFRSVAAVTVTQMPHELADYTVELELDSGRSVFISNDRRHADELAALLGVPRNVL